MDMPVCERLNQDDVQPLGYFPAEQGVFVLALIGSQPHLATVDTVPSKLEALSAKRFVTVAALFLEEAEEYLEQVMICGPDLFPAELCGTSSLLTRVKTGSSMTHEPPPSRRSHTWSVRGVCQKLR